MRSGYVAIVGAPNVGKSTLLNRILNEKISITASKPQTTRNRIMGILNSPGHQMIFVDTPGIHRARDSFNRMMVDTALSTLSEVDVICFLIEASGADREIDRFILENLQKVNTPVLLLINKIDALRDKKELLPVIEKFRGIRDFHTIIPISALTGDGVDAVVREIAELLPEGPRYYPEDYITDQPERFLVAELIREKVFHLIHQEIPYAVAVMVDTFTEEADRNLISIEATIHVERDSQKAIVIGKNGQMLKEIGKQAREDIERLLGWRVYLGLFVRVQKNWRKDPRVLTDFGYPSGN
ncbi:MAG: GTPase Era [Desulfobacteraceae bacterium]|nr:GTPase Era [Desulfobacteraceae bacterium]